MTLNKRRILMESSKTSQFNYCPVIWMIHSRGLTKKINNIHERKALRIVYDNYNSSFEDLLNTDNSVTIQQCNLPQLAKEVFKVKIRISRNIYFCRKQYV